MVINAKIRRMYFRENLPINEIARRMSLSRNFIKKCLNAPEGADAHRRVKTSAGAGRRVLDQFIVAGVEVLSFAEKCLL